jgi:hypothetical protein
LNGRGLREQHVYNSQNKRADGDYTSASVRGYARGFRRKRFADGIRDEVQIFRGLKLQSLEVLRDQRLYEIRTGRL